MVRCSFCGNNIEQGTGKLLAKNDSTLLYYCSNKCEKNHQKLKRIPRKVKWTQDFRKAKTTK